MGKYINVQDQVFSIFNSPEWKAERIKTIPVNFLNIKSLGEYIRISIIPSGDSININSVSGVIIADLFTKSGNGPKQSFIIADKLDTYLKGVSLTADSHRVQFQGSSLVLLGQDSDDPTLFRATYTIPFSYFEVK